MAYGIESFFQINKNTFSCILFIGIMFNFNYRIYSRCKCVTFWRKRILSIKHEVTYFSKRMCKKFQRFFIMHLICLESNLLYITFVFMPSSRLLQLALRLLIICYCYVHLDRVRFFCLQFYAVENLKIHAYMWSFLTLNRQVTLT